MDKSQVQNTISRKIKDLTIQIDELRQLSKPIETENSIGRISRMDAINNKSINDRMLRNSEEKLQNLTISLLRINNSDFGICIKCKNPINFKRILLVPEVLKCVNCG